MSSRLLTLAVLFACGCYEYLPPPELQSSLSGKRVQITLTDMGSAALAKDIGPQIDAVGGLLLADSADALQVSVNSVTSRSGLETGWNGERVTVPRGYIARLEERRLSKPRTAFASAVLMAGLVIAQRAFGGSGGANAPGGTPGGPGTGR